MLIGHMLTIIIGDSIHTIRFVLIAVLLKVILQKAVVPLVLDWVS